MNKSEIEFANEQRERLIEIIKNADNYTLSLDDEFADYLLFHGVVVREKGEWEPTEDVVWDVAYRCSSCGEEFYLADGTPDMNNYYFCPNCGADMRKEK